jgi:magnesium-transporting ATPase (P-type)
MLCCGLLQVGLQGYGSMPEALAVLSPAERATYCNDAWAKMMPRLSTLEFTRDRKMMSTLTAGRRGQVLYLKVRLTARTVSLSPG